MKTNIMRGLAITLGLSVATVAQAQYGNYPASPGYQPQRTSTVPVHPSLQQPQVASNWNNYQPPATLTAPTTGQAPAYGQPAPAFSQPGPGYPQQAPINQSVQQVWPNSPYRTASTGSGQIQPEILPSVQHQHSHQHSQHYPSSPAIGSPVPAPVPTPANGGSYVGGESCYSETSAAPWAGTAPMQYGSAASCAPPMESFGPPKLRNWFAGSNLLFLEMEQNCDRRLLFDQAMPTTTGLRTSQVDPGSNVGFETFIGRYFNCGQHAVMASYFFFDPTSEMAAVDRGPMPGSTNYRVMMPSWNNVMYDVGLDGMPGNDVSFYDLYDSNQRYRTSRDVSFQSIELNLVSFGIGGARRAGLGACGGGCGGSCGTGSCGPEMGCGGVCGPMIPGCGSKLQLQTTHGLRWFQFKDAFEFASSQTDTFYGPTTDDLYYNIDTENNLFGYQFGARLDYCLGRKLNVYAGTKFGIYANDAEFRSRLGTTGTAGYVSGTAYPSLGGQAVVTNNSSTVLATMGELDLGLGYRINNCWSISGGYRLYGVTGVATSVGSIADDLANLPVAGQVCANDSIVIQGGYIGAEYNW
ncbi:hypothetical protein FF011L_41570 [Roseimaritima multifibrata]|uniref:Legionella pneumophila major outer membrane protein n=1 Tax=Roseimaritima multifibrata TaxID=1930274 RepID=A0A517MKF0_9BACT|nr:BBP7 family outer membrane beta-barrel protein [Roseimaritima multifibrata]QDS95363.1 hypothetical protein FF011L_41570 [Roseimaritima multifibrata]